MAFSAINDLSIKIFTLNNIICMTVASLFIGGVYPLTQIYQHDADQRDGVISLSYKLGYTGTFVFSAILFSMATLFLYYYFNLKHQLIAILLFAILMLPVVIKLSLWFNKVLINAKHADFENTMMMNLLTSSCMNMYLLVLILNNHYSWF